MDYDCGLSMRNVEKFNPDRMFELNENVLPAKRAEQANRSGRIVKV